MKFIILSRYVGADIWRFRDRVALQAITETSHALIVDADKKLKFAGGGIFVCLDKLVDLSTRQLTETDEIYLPMNFLNFESEADAKAFIQTLINPARDQASKQINMQA